MKEKTVDDILREEFLKERAVVLGRTGESVAKAIVKLRHLDQIIEKRHEEMRNLEQAWEDAADRQELRMAKAKAIHDINRKIAQYNRLWDHAQLRYYYLIVTREAMGLRSHHRVEEIYRIPPRKKQLSGE
ncbi:MAG TPA: hypothetical protein PK175_07230 [Syntrophales bacterium]|jgi:hypothetical protein|nr:hypothetical protein [Syntrophales bacterium]HON23472.1 hypothetical protein [Syntrophales bacterium]HOU77629.1 hypothetical protein [Syntrophales bacterium]HPC31980.1 hypothetical protein [Syntrophales bacterium]HQG34643.1 hypothetical protein [Syntrophales bacterium]